MTAMEKSLRRALEAGDATDPAFRESIYAASERALERMIAAKPVDEAAAHMQRTRLAETINRVEDDFYSRQTAAGAAADGPAQHDPALSLDPAYMDAHAYSTHPADAEDARGAKGGDDFELTPVFDDEAGFGPAKAMMATPAEALGDGHRYAGVTEPVQPSVRERSAAAARQAMGRGRAQPRRFFLVVLAVLAILGIGALIVYASTGMAEPEAASGAGDGRWIDLFEGKRLDALATPNGGRMETVGDAAAGDRPAVRFTPAAGASDVTVAIGPGVVESIAGHKVSVEIAVGSPDGASREFSVECRLGNRDVCGRQTFATARRNETFVFDMDVPEGASDGQLAITPTRTASSDGRLDLYAVRLRNS